MLKTQFQEMLALERGLAPTRMALKLEREGRAKIRRGVNQTGDMSLWSIDSPEHEYAQLKLHGPR